MLEFGLLIFVAIIFFIASYIKSTTGVGFGLFSVPILLFFLPPITVIPLVLVLVFLVELMTLFATKESIGHKRMWFIILGAIFSVPLGMSMLASLSEQTSTLFIALGVIGIIIFALITERRLETKKTTPDHLPSSPITPLFVGIVSGIFHGLSSLSTPIVATHLERIGVKRKEFRADLIAFSAVMSAVALVFAWYHSMFTAEIVFASVFSVPFIILGTYLGIGSLKLLNQKNFNRIVTIIIVLSATASLVKAAVIIFA